MHLIVTKYILLTHLHFNKPFNKRFSWINGIAISMSDRSSLLINRVEIAVHAHIQNLKSHNPYY